MLYNGKILIVDDERRMCESLKDLLSAHGYEVKTCCNGQNALECLAGNTVDLVLLDIGMEEMDGFQVMERMAQQHLDIPVIIMTGDASTGSAVEALRRGAYDYLRKPFEPEELFISVKNALNQRKLKKDHQLVKKKLRDNELHFRTLFNQPTDYIFIVNLAHKDAPVIMDANEAACTDYGYTHEEFIDKPFLSVTTKHAEIIQRLMPGQGLVFESEHIRKDGTVFPVGVCAKMIMVSGNPYLYYVARNLTNSRSIEEIAREKAAATPEKLPTQSSEINPETLDDIKVHQIELEMQNEELRRTQYELDAERAKYFDFYDLAPVGYISLSERGVILDANLTSASLLGMSRGALVGQKPPITQFILTDDQDIYYRCRKQLFETGGRTTCELRMVNKNGKVFWVSLAATIAQDVDGASVCRVVMGDITERHLAEEALRESEERFRRFFMNAPMPYQSLDESGNFLDVNSTFLGVLGYSREEVIGTNFAKFLHPDMVDHFKENFPRFKAIGEVLGVEFEMVKKDGSTILVSFNGKIQRDDQGRFQRTHCIFQDITESKLAQQALQESEARFRSVIEDALVGYFRIGLDGRFQDVNNTWLRLHGYTVREQVIGRHFSFTQIDDSREESQKIVDTLLQGKSIPLGEFSRRCQDGSIGYHNFSATPIRHGDRIVGLEGFLIDITDRKRMEAEKTDLEAQNRQLQKAESLSRMAGAIAHHFNNQLMVVMGNLELVMGDLPHGDTHLENLTCAMKATRRAAELSGRMLTYLGQTTSEQEPIDICQACNRSLLLLRAALPKRILMETHFASPGPVISGNENQIQQVLASLLTNAQEAVGDGLGAIELTVRTVLAAEIPATHRYPIDWQPRNSVYACLEVADSGCGLAEKDIEKIFDPFFTTKFTGRGLGLSVTLGIIKAHRGAITVERKRGKGSIFRVFLPVSTEMAVPSRPESVIAPQKKRSVTVLLVEDEEGIRKTAKVMLTRLGFTVFATRDGVEAVEVFRRHKDEINCVLCDLTMPRMNGWETLTALRDLSPNFPVILFSGHDEGQVMAGDHTDRPDAFLHKPFSRKELADVIEQILAKK
jgi:two-component system, cell cycle sensor histidine kinase and response regulator CckA